MGRLGLLVGGLFGLLVGAVIVPALATSTDFELPDPGIGTGGALALVVLGALLAIPLHELGHVVAGLTQGMRLDMLCVGPAMLLRVDGKLQLRRTFSVLLWGGAAAMSPPLDQGASLSRRLAIFTAGGPLATILTGAAAAAVAWTAGASHGAVALFAWTLALSSVALLMAVTLPSTTGGMATDRARLQALLGGGPRAELATAVAAIQAHDAAGLRPAEWPSALVETLERTADDSPDGIVARINILPARRYDLGEHEGVLADLEDVWEQDVIPDGLLRSITALEIARLRVKVRGDLEGAKALREAEQLEKRVPPMFRHGADVVFLTAEGADPEDIERARTAALRFYRSLPPSGSIETYASELRR